MLRSTFLFILLISGSFQTTQAQAVPRLTPVVPQVQLLASAAQVPEVLRTMIWGRWGCVQILSSAESPNETAAKNERGTATERQQVRAFLAR